MHLAARVGETTPATAAIGTFPSLSATTTAAVAAAFAALTAAAAFTYTATAAAERTDAMEWGSSGRKARNGEGAGRLAERRDEGRRARRLW